MTPTQQILAWLGGAMVALSPLAYAVIRLLVARAELARLETEKAKADLEAEHAYRSVQRAKEERAARGLTGAEAAAIAEADFKKRVPDATDESAKGAVLSAVGEIEDVGESRKKDVTP